MSYDPTARRDTQLAMVLKARIKAHGPLPISSYMDACLHDLDHGYYVKRDAIGASADFITAPEISQIFGELIGLWSVIVWQQMGTPAQFKLIEMGPGRGTMMRDAIRAVSAIAPFANAVRIGLVEPSPTLRKIQLATLKASPLPVAHLDHLLSLDGIPPSPTVLIGNEVLDCYAIEQRVFDPIGDQENPWCVRTVGLDDADRFFFGTGHRLSPTLPETLAAPMPGDILESMRLNLLFEGLGRHTAPGAEPMAALFIDYGHAAPGYGDTLQAVRNHAYEHPLTSPGEADLTAHVDFSQVADAARHVGLHVDGPITQAEFLGSLGIIERASKLMAANPARAGEIEASVMRLMAPNGMGTRFKVIGLRSSQVPKLPGF